MMSLPGGIYSKSLRFSSGVYKTCMEITWVMPSTPPAVLERGNGGKDNMEKTY